MPFFSGRKREPSPPPREPTPPPVEEPRRRGLFSRRERSPDYMHQQDYPQQQHYPPQQQPVDPEPHGRRGHGLFGRRHRSPSPSASGGMAGPGPRGRDSMTSHSSMSSGGYHDGPDRADTHRSGGMKRGFLSKRGRGRDTDADDNDLDPSIIHARDRLMGAEAAEEDARRALAAAKDSAASARDDIHRLEAEAREDARRAKIKESQARDFSKRGKALGRTLR